jgi:hypothetical protein
MFMNLRDPRDSTHLREPKMKSFGFGVMISVIGLYRLGAAYAQAKDETTACKSLAEYMLVLCPRNT